MLYCFQSIKLSLGYSMSFSYYFRKDKKYRLIEINTHRTQQALDTCILTKFGNGLSIIHQLSGSQFGTLQK